MAEDSRNPQESGRRNFIKTAGVGLAAGGALLSGTAPVAARALTEKEKIARIASNTWPARHLFKRREGDRPPSDEVVAMKKKYGEITMMDFAQFTKDTWPGVTHMDLWSSLFGDFTDDQHVRGEDLDPGRAHPHVLGVRPVDGRGEEVARQAGQQERLRRCAVRSRVQQCPPGHLRPGRGEAQGGHPGGEELDGRRGHPRRQDDAREHRRPPGGPLRHHRDRLPQERRDREVPGPLHRFVQADGGVRREGRGGGHHREPLGTQRRPHDHPGHPGRGEQPLRQGLTGLLQLGARVPPLPRPQGIGAVLHHHRPRQVLGPLGRGRRPALHPDHGGRRATRAGTPWSTRPARGTASRAPTTSSRRSWPPCRGQ